MFWQHEQAAMRSAPQDIMGGQQQPREVQWLSPGAVHGSPGGPSGIAVPIQIRNGQQHQHAVTYGSSAEANRWPVSIPGHGHPPSWHPRPAPPSVPEPSPGGPSGGHWVYHPAAAAAATVPPGSPFHSRSGGPLQQWREEGMGLSAEVHNNGTHLPLSHSRCHAHEWVRHGVGGGVGGWLRRWPAAAPVPVAAPVPAAAAAPNDPDPNFPDPNFSDLSSSDLSSSDLNFPDPKFLDPIFPDPIFPAAPFAELAPVAEGAFLTPPSGGSGASGFQPAPSAAQSLGYWYPEARQRQMAMPFPVLAQPQLPQPAVLYQPEPPAPPQPPPPGTAASTYQTSQRWGAERTAPMHAYPTVPEPLPPQQPPVKPASSKPSRLSSVGVRTLFVFWGRVLDLFGSCELKNAILSHVMHAT